MYERRYEVTIHRPGHAARQARKERAERKKRTVCGIMAAVFFFSLLCVVDAVSRGYMELRPGVLYMALGMGGFALFVWLAGGFDYEA